MKNLFLKLGMRKTHDPGSDSRKCTRKDLSPSHNIKSCLSLFFEVLTIFLCIFAVHSLSFRFPV